MDEQRLGIDHVLHIEVAQKGKLTQASCVQDRTEWKEREYVITDNLLLVEEGTEGRKDLRNTKQFVK